MVWNSDHLRITTRIVKLPLPSMLLISVKHIQERSSETRIRDGNGNSNGSREKRRRTEMNITRVTVMEMETKTIKMDPSSKPPNFNILITMSMVNCYLIKRRRDVPSNIAPSFSIGQPHTTHNNTEHQAIRTPDRD